MKIIRKISLKRGIERYIQPAPSYPRLTQYDYKNKHPENITVNEELHKYGIRPKYHSPIYAFSIILGALSALSLTFYFAQLYRNEKDVIYRYRYHQIQQSSLRLKFRILIFKFMQHMESNLHLAAFMKQQRMGKKNFNSITQGHLRYQQYCHFMQNKQRKFDFVDIGILQKFPYPKKVQKQM